MFALRRITSENVELNQALGKHYTKVSREYSPQEFERCYKEHFKGEDDARNEAVFAFVSNGEIIQPLYANQHNYIVTESGTTYEKITI